MVPWLETGSGSLICFFLLNAYVARGNQHIGAEMLGEVFSEQNLDSGVCAQMDQH